MHLPTTASIVDMTGRDGFQMEPEFIPTEQKIEIIDLLSRSGVRQIQVTSFVHPRAVPQLQDAEAVMRGITRVPGVTYRVLVPNLRTAIVGSAFLTATVVLGEFTIASLLLKETFPTYMALYQARQPVKPLVRNIHESDVGLDGTKPVVGSLCLCTVAHCIE